jgi:outer membrane protein assembly factor BamB
MYIEEIERKYGPIWIVESGVNNGLWELPLWCVPEQGRFPGARFSAAISTSQDPGSIGLTVTETEMSLRTWAEIDRCDDNACLLIVENPRTDTPFTEVTIHSSDLPDQIDGQGESFYLRIDLRYDPEQSSGTPASNARVRGDIDHTTAGVRLEQDFYPNNVDRLHCFGVDNGILYAYTKLSHTGVVIGEERRTGDRLWTKEFDPDDWDGSIHGRAVQVLNEVICVLLKSGGVIAVNAATGELLWSDHSFFDSMATSDSDTIVIASENSIQRIDPVTRTARWTVEQPDSFRGLTTTDEVVVLGHDDGITALDADTGSGKWRAAFDPSHGTDSSAIDEALPETTLAAHSSSGDDIDPELLAVDITDETVVVATTTNLLVGLDATTGAQRWQTTYDGDLEWVAATDSVVALATDGELICGLDPATGESCWQAAIDLEYNVERTDEMIYIANKHGRIRAYSLATGTFAWQYETQWRTWPPRAPEQMVAADDRLYLHTYDTELADEPADYQIEVLAQTGSTQRQFQGVVDDLRDDELARIDLITTEGAGDDADTQMQVPRDRLPWYGDFEQAHYDVVIGTASEYDQVSGERQRASAQITEFELTVDERDDDTGRLSLTPLDEELPEGSAVVPADGLAEDCRDPGATGYASILLIYNEDTTPNEAIPEEYQ